MHVYDVLFDAKFNAYYITLLCENEKCVCVCENTHAQTAPFYNLGKMPSPGETFSWGVVFPSVSMTIHTFHSGTRKQQNRLATMTFVERKKLFP